jgi:hypothetical protein
MALAQQFIYPVPTALVPTNKLQLAVKLLKPMTATNSQRAFTINRTLAQLATKIQAG